MSSYQVAEILEVLGKSGVDQEMRLRILHDFEKSKFYVKNISSTDAIRAVTDSVESDIHVYDYSAAYPVRDIVVRIYSADLHFMHKDFTTIAEVVNPMSPWLVSEGGRPHKTKKTIV